MTARKGTTTRKKKAGKTAKKRTAKKTAKKPPAKKKATKKRATKKATKKPAAKKATRKKAKKTSATKKTVKKKAAKRVAKKKSTRKKATRTTAGKATTGKRSPSTPKRATAATRAKPAAPSSSKRESIAAGFPRPIGVIAHFFPHAGAGIVAIDEGEVQVGDTVHIRGHTTDFYQRIDRIEIDRQPIEVARAGQVVGIHVSQRVREGDVVRVVST